jgi:phosphopantetheinyl transferase/acyl carrier protein
MEQFLTVQQDVMQAFLSGQAAAPPVGVAPPVDGAEGSEEGLALKEGVAPAPVEAQEVSTRPMPASGEGAQPASLPAGEGASDGAATIQETFLQLVSQRTGYPTEMLGLDLNLEADLSIDSIKRVEILGLFQQRVGLLEAGDMEKLADCRTLREVIDYVTARGEEATDVESPSRDDATGDSPAAQSLAVPSMPFIRTLVSIAPGEALEALCDLDLDEDLFLRDHTLGRQVSVADPELKGLPVMPFTMSMEIMAEAAAVLVPGQQLVEMRDVRAYRWIALEERRLALRVVARRDPDVSGVEVCVQIHEADAAPGSQSPAATPIVEGRVILGATYPRPPVAEAFTLQDACPSRWTPEQLYTEVMFHGPAFQGVVSMDQTGADGVSASLRALPTTGLFRSIPDPPLITDPVLLDQPGQVVGFWTAEHLETGYVIFPFRLESLHLYGPRLDPGECVTCQARIHLVGEQRVRSDLSIVRGDGQVWAHFVGWEDRRFDLPDTIFRALISPQDTVLSETWPTPLSSLPVSEAFQAYRLGIDDLPDGFLTAHGGIWQRVLAHLVLGRQERELWRSSRKSELRRLEWLLGRVAAKDAVCQYLRQHEGLVLCPADVEILPDERGRPVAQGPWIDRVQTPPILSIAHANGLAVAVAEGGDVGTGIGVDIEHVGAMSEGALQVAFTPDEQTLLLPGAKLGGDNWPLRLWCAKEAIAKALGQGMVGGPQALVVDQVDPHTGTVQVRLSGEQASRASQANGIHLTAHTACEGALVVAVSLYRSEERTGQG